MWVNIKGSIDAAGPRWRPEGDRRRLRDGAVIGHRNAQLELVGRRAQIGMPDADQHLAAGNGAEPRLARSVGACGEGGVDDVDEGDHIVVDVAAERDDAGPVEMDAARLLAGVEPELEAAD